MSTILLFPALTLLVFTFNACKVEVQVSDSGGGGGGGSTNTATTNCDIPTTYASATQYGYTANNTLSWSSLNPSACSYTMRVRRSALSGSAPFTQILNGSTASSYLDNNGGSGLTYGTYNYIVDVYHTNGSLLASNNISSTTTAPVTPLQPNSFTATSNSASQITLTWSSGGGTTTGYKVAYQSGATAPANCSSGSVATSPFAVTGLSTATQYSFRVCSTSDAGLVSSGVTVSATTNPAIPPVPTGLSAVGLSSTIIKLTFTSGGGTTAGYKIAYTTGATAPASCSSGSPISTSLVATYNVGSLTANTQYSFRVCAINSTGDISTTSVTASATTTSSPCIGNSSGTDANNAVCITSAANVTSSICTGSTFGKYYELGNNIDMGGSMTPCPAFSGTLDGKGYTISNFSVSSSGSDLGFFTSLNTGAHLLNLGMSGSVTCTSGGSNIGLVAGSMASGTTLSRLSVSGTVTNSSANTSSTGGVIGSTGSGATIEKIRANVTVTATTSHCVGGIVGTANNSPVTKSLTLGSLRGCMAGGIVGCAGSSLTFSENVSRMAINGNSTDFYCTSYAGVRSVAGGLIGEMGSSTVLNSYFEGSITSSTSGASEALGGLVGDTTAASSQITNSYNVGSVNSGSSNSGYGSLLGNLFSNTPGTITKSFWSSSSTGQTTSCTGCTLAGGSANKTTLQMKTAGIFYGWDPLIWIVPPAPAGTDYPRLGIESLLANPLVDPAAPSAPIAPTLLTPGWLSDSAINFTWSDNSNNETAFEVQRCVQPNCNSSDYVTIDSAVAANSTSYTQSTSISSNTTYRYRVRATNSGGSSAWTTSGDLTALADGDPSCTNDQVYASARAGNRIYISGNFTRVGVCTGGGSHIDLSTGTVPTGFRGLRLDPGIQAVAPDPNEAGAFYIGGAISTVGGVTRSNLARIKSDGTLDTTFNPVVNSDVLAIAVGNGSVYIGGSFSTVGGQTRNRIAAVDATTGAVTSFNPVGAGGSVYALALSGTTLYVGGNFTSMGGASRQNLTAVSTTTGLATSWYPIPSAAVTSLYLDSANNLIYAGGTFTQIQSNSATRNRIAAISTSTGNATSWNPDSNGTVNAITLSGTTLYIGGSFTTVGGQTRNKIAAIDTTSGTVTSWDPNASADVAALAINGSNVLVGGSFTTIGGQTRSGIAAIDESSGTATTWNPESSGSFNIVQAIGISGTSLYLAGYFRFIGGQFRNHIAALNSNTGVPTSFNPNANDSISSMVISQDILYVGGEFTSVGGQSRNKIAALDLTTGLATSWNPNSNGAIYTLAMNLSGDILYAGGTFTSIGGQSRAGFAALDVSTGLATSWNPNANINNCRTILVTPGSLFVGGGFSSIGGQNRNRIAELDPGTAAASPWNPDSNDSPMVLTNIGSTIYVAGFFTTIGGQSRNKIAALDAYSGLATSWNPNSSTLVTALAVSTSSIYVGAAQGTIGGQTRYGVSEISLATGLATSWNPQAYGSVATLLVSGANIHIGGGFPKVGTNLSSPNFSAFDRTNGNLLTVNP